MKDCDKLFQMALPMAAKNTEEYHSLVLELNRMKATALTILTVKSVLTSSS